MRRQTVGPSQPTPGTSKLAKRTLTFTIDVTVDTGAIAATLVSNDGRSPQAVVADEIASNLESVSYVEAVNVRRNKA